MLGVLIPLRSACLTALAEHALDWYVRSALPLELTTDDFFCGINGANRELSVRAQFCAAATQCWCMCDLASRGLIIMHGSDVDYIKLLCLYHIITPFNMYSDIHRPCDMQMGASLFSLEINPLLRTAFKAI